MRHTTLPFDSDITHERDAAYWAAALAVAVRRGDPSRIALARRKLRRLGCPIDVLRPRTGKVVRDGR